MIRHETHAATVVLVGTVVQIALFGHPTRPDLTMKNIRLWTGTKLDRPEGQCAGSAGRPLPKCAREAVARQGCRRYRQSGRSQSDGVHMATVKLRALAIARLRPFLAALSSLNAS